MAAGVRAPARWLRKRYWNRFCPRLWWSRARPIRTAAGRLRLDYDRPQSVGRVRMFYGNFGMFVRALAYIMANGPDGLRQTTEDAVLNANYIRKNLEDVYELPYRTPTLHEVVFSDRRQTQKGVKTGDIAKRLIDYGFHPYTTSFPLDRAWGPDDRADGKRIEGRARSVYRRHAADRPRGGGEPRAGAQCAARHAHLAPGRGAGGAQTGAALHPANFRQAIRQTLSTLKAGKMPAPESAIAQRRDDLERFEFMMGAERGRLAVTLDMLTDALILIGQHGVYCTSTRNPSKPALDLEAVLSEISGAKELIQSVMEQLRLKGESPTQP